MDQMSIQASIAAASEDYIRFHKVLIRSRVQGGSVVASRVSSVDEIVDTGP